MNRQWVTSSQKIFILTMFFLAGAGQVSVVAQPNGTRTPPTSNPARITSATHYRINLTLDFDKRSFSGIEHVRWTNRDHRPASVLYFHLYPNHRGDIKEASASRARAGAPLEEFTPLSPVLASQPLTPSDEPRLEVTEVRAALSGQPLVFSLDDGGVTLRVQLSEAVAPAAATELEVTFRGTVPEISADETSLTTHVIQQVGAAMRETREWRRARDINFLSRGVMLLGAAYPVLAVRDGDNWQRKVEPSIGDMIHTEPANYVVTMSLPHNVAVFTSAETSSGRGGGGESAGSFIEHAFAGENLRTFAIIAGRALRSSEQTVSGVRVRSIYLEEHETTGRRVLNVAAESVRVFMTRFGALPFQTVNVTEAPLVAGLGSAEFACLGVIASAFYVDFDGPAMRNLPEIVREQRASVEDSLEFAVAHVVAHQWWGASVGNDPESAPVLDEALAHWSAFQYYKETYGETRAAQTLDDQLRGVYQIYRTFGGEDMAADRAAREYRNSFQYAAIVSSKGALMFTKLQTLMGEERFWKAIKSYHEANRFEIAELGDLEAAFVAEAPVNERRSVTRILKRWLTEKHGDEDIAPPNPQLAAALGISVEHAEAKDRNAFSRLGRFFWRQMTRIR